MLQHDFAKFYKEDSVYETTISLALMRWRGLYLKRAEKYLWHCINIPDLKRLSLTQTMQIVDAVSIHFVESREDKTEVDSIKLTSLFADEFDRRAVFEALRVIEAQFSKEAESGDAEPTHQYKEMALSYIEGLPGEVEGPIVPVLQKLDHLDATDDSYEYVRYYIHLFAWVKAWYLKAVYNADDRSPLHYYYEVMDPKGPTSNCMQNLMYIGAKRYRARKNLRNPRVLKPLHKIDGLEDWDVRLYKLDKESTSNIEISNSDLDSCRKYLQILRDRHPPKQEIRGNRKEKPLPKWLSE